MTPAEALVIAIRSRGSDATDLRDAAHEAHHAIEARVPEGKWDRESIHRYLMRGGKAQSVASEVTARAVEQLVCAHFGVDPGPVSKWAFVACMEAMKGGIGIPSVEWMAKAVEERMASRHGREAADAVIALVSIVTKPRGRKASRHAV